MFVRVSPWSRPRAARFLRYVRGRRRGRRSRVSPRTWLRLRRSPRRCIRRYDVFISHATEDKESIVRDLALELRKLGLEVWYDEFTLRIGDNLRRKIDAGLASSRFGVVVLSRYFFAKEWSQYELDGLVTREMGGEQQIILPLWHNMSRDDVAEVSPSLANKVALRTADLSIDEIAAQIADVVGGAD